MFLLSYETMACLFKVQRTTLLICKNSTIKPLCKNPSWVGAKGPVCFGACLFNLIFWFSLLARAACIILILYMDFIRWCVLLPFKIKPALPEACAVDQFSCSFAHYPLWIHLARDHCKATGSPFACLGAGMYGNNNWITLLVTPGDNDFWGLQQGPKSFSIFQRQGERPPHTPTKTCVKLFIKEINGHLSTDSLSSK